MNVNLMFRDKDFLAKPCYAMDVLESDLELSNIISQMSRGDKIIAGICSEAIFSPLISTEEINYRQETLKDALNNPEAVRELYEITSEAAERKKDSMYRITTTQYLTSNFSSSIGLLKIYIDIMKKLRNVADNNIRDFKAESFTRLLSMFQKEFSEKYFKEVRSHLDELKGSDDILISATLGNYIQGVNYVLRRKNRKGFRRRWTFAPSLSVAEQDEIGAVDLQKRRNRAINEITSALVQAVENIESFLEKLQTELAFYMGCLNLNELLEEIGMPICIPELLPFGKDKRSWINLYDVGLVLTKKETVVGNDLTAENKKLYIITGANQGGKTTFLRSLGQAQLMAQCGMFVGAESFTSPIRNGILTHFKKEEDEFMKSGKLDEELSRMSKLSEHIESGYLVMFNESFASTNEREGSEICRQITQALIDNDVEVFSVTHLFTYAKEFKTYPKTMYLRAQRLDSGERTFKLEPGEPLETAFGEDLYKKIFPDKVKLPLNN